MMGFHCIIILISLLLIYKGDVCGVDVTGGPDVTIGTSETALLLCSYENAVNAIIRRTWTKLLDTGLRQTLAQDTGGGFVPSVDRYSVIQPTSNDMNLQITNTTGLDTGIYWCEVEELILGGNEANVRVTVNSPPCKPIIEGASSVNGTDSVVLQCTTECGTEPIMYTIVKDDTHIPLDNGTYNIPHVTKADEGKYTCIAENRFGSMESDSHYIAVPFYGCTVIGISNNAKQVFNFLKDKITCNVNSDCSPNKLNITWENNGEQTGMLTDVDEATLKLELNAGFEETNITVCNSLGCDFDTVYIKIIYLPLWGFVIIIIVCIGCVAGGVVIFIIVIYPRIKKKKKRSKKVDVSNSGTSNNARPAGKNSEKIDLDGDDSSGDK